MCYLIDSPLFVYIDCGPSINCVYAIMTGNVLDMLLGMS